MSGNFIQDQIETGEPFEIYTASGKKYFVQGADFIHFSAKKTAVFVTWIEDDGEDHGAIIPLLTITSIEGSKVA